MLSYRFGLFLIYKYSVLLLCLMQRCAFVATYIFCTFCDLEALLFVKVLFFSIFRVLGHYKVK